MAVVAGPRVFALTARRGVPTNTRIAGRSNGHRQTRPAHDTTHAGVSPGENGRAPRADTAASITYSAASARLHRAAGAHIDPRRPCGRAADARVLVSGVASLVRGHPFEPSAFLRARRDTWRAAESPNRRCFPGAAPTLFARRGRDPAAGRERRSSAVA